MRALPEFDTEPELDLVDEMEWEDHIDFLSLVEAGLETQDLDTVNGACREYFADESKHEA